jgi:glucokinase
MASEAVGIDIGGTRIKIGRVNERGEVLARAQIAAPVDVPAETAIERIAAAAAPLLAGPGGVRLGVGCAGLIDSRRGVVHTSPNLPLWHNLELGRLLEVHLGTPATVTNDANAFALAEACLGAGRGHSIVVGLTLGTGVGGAIVIHGRLFGGLHGFAGEIGHMSIDTGGPPCPCGNRGCLELFVGRRGIVSAYLEDCTWRSGSPGHDLAGGRQESLDPELIARAAAQGDPAAHAAFARAGEALGGALADVANLLDPALFVVGGGVSQAGQLILEPARRVLAARAMARSISVPPIVPAALGVDAGLIGAALHSLAASEAGGGA